MDFVPINDDHAIQSVAFTLFLDNPLTPAEIAAAQDAHERWREDLPAVTPFPGFDFPFPLGGPPVAPMFGPGVGFSYLRPDGTPAWQLRFHGPTITVECTRYTRWERVWQAAQRYLVAAAEVLGHAGAEHHVGALSLQVLDRFRAEREPYDLRSLLRADTAYLAPAIFERGTLWHSHLGWFDENDYLGLVLNHFNVDSQREAAGGPGNTETPLVVGLSHLQQLRYKTPQRLADFPGLAGRMLDKAMLRRHTANKQLVGSVLTEPVRQRIGLEPSVAVEGVPS